MNTPQPKRDRKGSAERRVNNERTSMTFESFMSPSRRATRDPYPHYMTAAEIAAALPGKRTAAEVTRAMQAYTATLVPTPELQWPDGLKRWYFNSVGHAFHLKPPVWMRLWEVWQFNRA